MIPVVILTPLKVGYIGGGQRPIQLAKAFSSMGCTVFISSRDDENFSTPWGASVRSTKIIADLPEWPPFMDEFRARKICDDILSEIPEDDFIVINCWNSAWNSHYLQQVFSSVKRCFLFWDIMDLWEEFDADKHQPQTEELLIKFSNAITASAKELCDHYNKRYSRSVEYIPNAFNLDIFRETKRDATLQYFTPDPDKISFLYLGTLYRETMDWKLIRHLANLGEKVSVYIAGPYADVIDKIKKNAGNDIFDIPNIFFIGEVPHSDIPDLIKNVDFCLQPFDPTSKMVQCISPLKIFLYIALGGRVICSKMREVIDMPNVYIYDDIDELRFPKLVYYRNLPLKPTRHFITSNLWTNRAMQFLEIYQAHKRRVVDGTKIDSINH